MRPPFPLRFSFPAPHPSACISINYVKVPEAKPQPQKAFTKWRCLSPCIQTSFQMNSCYLDEKWCIFLSHSATQCIWQCLLKATRKQHKETQCDRHDGMRLKRVSLRDDWGHGNKQGERLVTSVDCHCHYQKLMRTSLSPKALSIKIELIFHDCLVSSKNEGSRAVSRVSLGSVQRLGRSRQGGGGVIITTWNWTTFYASWNEHGNDGKATESDVFFSPHVSFPR